jgi:hypothetical protein
MPDIPAVSPAENLMLLGQGLMKVGSALGNIPGQKAPPLDPNQKAYKDAEIAFETMQATNYIDDQYNQFTTNLQSNPAHDTFGELYNQKNSEIWDGVQQFVKLPEVQTNIDKYLATKRDNVGKTTFALAKDKLANQTEQVGTQTLNDAVTAGDVQKVMDTRDLLLSRGVITEAKANDITDKGIPQAKYNNIFAQLLPMDQATRMAVLDSPDAMKRTGLAQDQIDNMAKSFTDRQTRQDAAAKREADISNVSLETQVSDKLIQYMEGGLRAAGFASVDKLYAYVGDLQWQGQTAGTLQKYWAEAFDSVVTRKADFKDPAKVDASWAIALDRTKDYTTKSTLLHDSGVLNNGVPGPLYQQMLNAAKDGESDPNKILYLQPLKDYYGSQLSALATKIGNESKMQDIAYKESVAIQTMQDVFRKYPDNPGDIWQSKIDEMMSPAITADVRKQVEDKLGQWFAPGTPTSVVLDVALEQFPALKENPKFMAEFQAGIASGELQKEETKVLAGAGVTSIKSVKQAPNGDFNYQVTDGTIYRVVGQVVGNRIHNVVQKYVNGTWINAK